jgi:hypothetical protein
VQEELIKNIKNSKLEIQEKQILLNLLPSLGENYLLFLFRESVKLHFEYAGGVLSEVVSMCINAEKQLLLGNTSEAEKILEIAPFKGWWENGAYILPWALDLQQKIKTNKKFQDTTIQNSLVKFYLNMFVFLPQSTVTFILENYCAKALKDEKKDLLLLLKKYISKMHWEGDAKLVKPFSDALLKNNEILSGKQIQVNEKNLPGTVSNLINDFSTSSTRSVSNLTVYDVTKYLISNKTALILENNNKEILLEILKIFLWLQKPIVTSGELEEYNEYESSQKEYFNSQLFELQEEGGMVEKSVPPDLGLKNDFIQVPPPVNIDQKLEDLKKRVKQ